MDHSRKLRECLRPMSQELSVKARRFEKRERPWGAGLTSGRVMSGSVALGIFLVSSLVESPDTSDPVHISP